ncbi:hypothetical protein N8I77_003038 [Diaporthe amygdali]|uniref:C2H2-type domain-containing protein n=1 Tax=Phomopsis amygdali TaxID=1214568 RepID=A0AAD9SI12_PHOAM|nr:hypothetical protein N8I77_003038 [Diaporthe amygdali]
MMDPQDQARLLRLHHSGHAQTFRSSDISTYNADANITPSAAQLAAPPANWLNQRDATSNSVAKSPTTYPRPPVANVDFLTTHRGTKSPASQDSNFPPDHPQILDPALSSSFCEHSRQEGPTANTCDTCKASFQTNSDLESHAKSLGHPAFRCKCGTPCSRYSSLARHINSKTGIGYHCGLCEDKTFGRIDKLYDHLRDGHKVSKRVLDRCKHKELRRTKKVSRPTESAQTPVMTSQATSTGGFWPAWSSIEQMNGATGRHTTSMPPSSPSGFNPVNFTNFSDSFTFQ